MLQFEDRIIDENGNVVFNDKGLLEYLYIGLNFDKEFLFFDSDEVKKYNHFNDFFNFKRKLSLKDKITSHKQNQQVMLIPEEYLKINLKEYFLNKVSTEEQKNRVLLELKAYRDKEIDNILFFLIYLVDIMKNNNIIWGVGRGSSCSSYLLFLLDLHVVDPLKHKLDITEFIK